MKYQYHCKYQYLYLGRQIEDNWWSEDDPTYHYLARGPASFDDPDESEWIEAAYMVKNGNYYYLFVNWFGCCDGVDSTYEIHVGRSTSVTGPFEDKEGKILKMPLIDEIIIYQD